jgi:hypothetical protein
MKHYFVLVSQLSNGETREHGQWEDYPSDDLIDLAIRHVRVQVGPNTTVLHTEVKKRYVVDSSPKEDIRFVLAVIPVRAGETYEEALVNIGDGRDHVMRRVSVKRQPTPAEQFEAVRAELRHELHTLGKTSLTNEGSNLISMLNYTSL